MKKYIFFLVAILSFQQLRAQQILLADTAQPVELDKGKPRLFHGMVIAGVNLSQVDGDQQSGFHKAGANVGVGLLVDLPKKFSVSMEILFSMKGANGDTQDFDSTGGTYGDGIWHDIHLDYVDIALMGNYNLTPWLMFSMGVIPDILVYYKDYFVYTPPAGVYDPTLGYRRVAMDGSLGLTFIFKKHWGFNFRWQYSMIRINQIAYSPGNAGIFVHTTFNGQEWNDVLAFRALYIF